MSWDQMDREAERVRLTAWVLGLGDEDFLYLIDRLAVELVDLTAPAELDLQALRRQIAQAEAEAAAGLGFSTEKMLAEVINW